jgi:hypothetical protein
MNPSYLGNNQACSDELDNRMSMQEMKKWDEVDNHNDDRTRPSHAAHAGRGPLMRSEKREPQSPV